jgi:hypothetical protein
VHASLLDVLHDAADDDVACSVESECQAQPPLEVIAPNSEQSCVCAVIMAGTRCMQPLASTLRQAARTYAWPSHTQHARSKVRLYTSYPQHEHATAAAAAAAAAPPTLLVHQCIHIQLGGPVQVLVHQHGALWANLHSGGHVALQVLIAVGAGRQGGLSGMAT